MKSASLQGIGHDSPCPTCGSMKRVICSGCEARPNCEEYACINCQPCQKCSDLLPTWDAARSSTIGPSLHTGNHCGREPSTAAQWRPRPPKCYPHCCECRKPVGKGPELVDLPCGRLCHSACLSRHLGHCKDCNCEVSGPQRGLQLDDKRLVAGLGSLASLGLAGHQQDLAQYRGKSYLAAAYATDQIL